MMKKNPFKEIINDKDVPEEVKEVVMSELNSTNLLTDFAYLFTLKFGSVFEDLIKNKKKK